MYGKHSKVRAAIVPPCTPSHQDCGRQIESVANATRVSVSDYSVFADRVDSYRVIDQSAICQRYEQRHCNVFDLAMQRH